MGSHPDVRRSVPTIEDDDRIRAPERRARAHESFTGIVVGDLEIPSQDGVVTRDGQVVPLTRTEFTLLSDLAAERGRVLGREKLVERIGPAARLALDPGPGTWSPSPTPSR